MKSVLQTAFRHPVSLSRRSLLMPLVERITSGEHWEGSSADVLE